MAPLQYLCLLLCVFLLEIIAGVLAYVTYQEVKSITLNWDVFEQRIYVKTKINLRCFPQFQNQVTFIYTDHYYKTKFVSKGFAVCTTA